MGTAHDGNEPPRSPGSVSGGSPQSREIRDAADLLALGVAAVTGSQADAAGVLEAGAATSAREISRGSDAVQATARELARDAAVNAQLAAAVVAEILAFGDAEATLTPEQARLVAVKAREASTELGTAVEASSAMTLASAAAGLAKEAADSAVEFELRTVGTAVAARNLAPAAVAAPETPGSAGSAPELD